MEEKMIEGRDAKKSNWLPFVVVVIAAVVLIFASGGDSDDAAKENSEAEKTELAGDVLEGGEGNSSVSLEGMLKLTIAKDFASWTPEAKLQDSKVVSRALTIEGDVEKAFLYVDASVGNKELTAFHSLYFKLVNSGGHLFRPETEDVEPGEGTTLLYNLSDLPYLPSIPYDETKAPERADLTSLLKEGSVPLVTSFVSSLEAGEINELSLYYACAEGSDCSITVR